MPPRTLDVSDVEGSRYQSLVLATTAGNDAIAEDDHETFPLVLYVESIWKARAARIGASLSLADHDRAALAPIWSNERVIVAAIEKHARGDVEALARGIIEELHAAGLEIRRIDATPIRDPRR
jgi:hypothetical protein